MCTGIKPSSECRCSESLHDIRMFAIIWGRDIKAIFRHIVTHLCHTQNIYLCYRLAGSQYLEVFIIALCHGSIHGTTDKQTHILYKRYPRDTKMMLLVHDFSKGRETCRPVAYPFTFQGTKIPNRLMAYYHLSITQ